MFKLRQRLRLLPLSACLVLLVIMIAGLIEVPQAGMNWDEEVQIGIGYHNYRIAQGKSRRPPGNYVAYGPVFNLLGEGLYQAHEVLQGRQPRIQLFGDYDSETGEFARYHAKHHAALRRRSEVNHRLTFLYTLMTFVAVGVIVGLLCGRQYAFLGMLLLACFPRFWGDSFHNGKDIPFATLYTLASLAGGWLLASVASLIAGVRSRIQTSEPTQLAGSEPAMAQVNSRQLSSRHLNYRQIITASLVFGAMTGQLTSARPGGAVLLFYTLVGVGLYLAFTPQFLQKRQLMLAIAASCLLSWVVSIYITTPASWRNFPYWFYTCFTYISQFPHLGCEAFFGVCTEYSEQPWYYIPTWLSITTPTIVQVLCVMGFSFLLYNLKKLTIVQRSLALALAAQILVLPVLAIALNSTVYNGLRQFYFMIPPLACFAAYGLVSSIQVLQKLAAGRWISVGFATCMALLLAQVLLDMQRLSPYSSLYFNTQLWGDEIRTQFSGDYWALSQKELAQAANTYAPRNSLVLSSGVHEVILSHLDNDFVIKAKYPQQLTKPALAKIQTAGYNLFKDPDEVQTLDQVEAHEWGDLQPALQRAASQADWDNAFYVVGDSIDLEGCEPIYQTKLTTLGIANTALTRCPIQQINLRE